MAANDESRGKAMEKLEELKQFSSVIGDAYEAALFIIESALVYSDSRIDGTTSSLK